MATFKFNLLKLDGYKRKIILFFFDNLICFFSFFLAYYLRLDTFLINETQNQILSFLILYFFFIFFCFIFSFYQPLSRYYDLINVAKVILVFFLYAILMTFLFDYVRLPGIPRSIGFIHPIIFLTFFISLRIFAHIFIRKIYYEKEKKNAVIYCDLKSAEYIKNIIKTYNIILFITNEKNFEKRLIGNIPIISLDGFNKSIINNKKIDFLFIDYDLNNEKIKSTILSKINQKKKINVKIIPKIQNFLDYQFNEDIKNIKISEKKINFSIRNLKKTFNESSILITGAGGSIGSELTTEIFKLQPKKVILIENSEFNLYKILEELNNLKAGAKNEIIIDYYLVSVTDFEKVKNICLKHKPNFIFHCAAFKHVPLVENNIIESVENNFISTMNLCDISLNLGISKLILISSDKAVRPSSIMGATKRLSELAIKYYSLKSNMQNKKTSFSAVRFANVLNSSGSVVPLFAKQILAGGPITLTHKKVERYFMTIVDAVKLVLETTLISKNGNIMLLKMGKQIKIINIAKKIAKFYGHTIKDKSSPSGDISVVEIGLRPGEKIREELFYDTNIKKTPNKDILCVDNFKLDKIKFEKMYESIKICLKNNDTSKLKRILLEKTNML
tara:strand:- start:879 stop:2729 length:1851 start_codon:yes stop_codon:yes gene_type:complete